MKLKDLPALTLMALGLCTLRRVEFGEDLFLLTLGVVELMAGAFAIIHSDA